MARTIGQVDFIVDFDGRALPVRARQLGEQAGQQASNGFRGSFRGGISRLGREIAGDMNDAGELAGISFTDGFQERSRAYIGSIRDDLVDAFFSQDGLDRIRERFGSVDDTVVALRDRMRELNATGNLSDTMWNRLGGTLNQWAGQAREAEDATERLRLRQVFLNDQVEALHTTLSNRTAFRNYIDHSDDAASATARLRRSIHDLRSEGALGDRMFFKLTESLERMSLALGDDDGGGGGGGGGGKGGANFRWKSLSHNLRQGIVIVALVIAAFEQLATLSSALSSGIVVLGGALTSFILGAGVFAIGIAGIADKVGILNEYTELAGQNLADLSDDQRARLTELQGIVSGYDPVVAAIANLGGAFTRLRDIISDRVFAGLGPQFEELGSVTLPALEDSFRRLADSVNVSVGRILDAFNSDRFEEQFGSLLELSGPVFNSLVNGLISLVGGIATVLLIAMPYVTRFADGFSDMMDRFDEWTNSVEGNTSIEQWFANGEKVIGGLLDLLGDVSDMLANLVDEGSVKRTLGFLDRLGDAMEPLGNFLGSLGALDIFGILAGVLAEVAASLDLVFQNLEPVFSLLSTLTLLGLDTVFLGLKAAADVLAFAMFPIVVAFEAINYLVQKAIEYFAPYTAAFEELTTALGSVGDEIFEGLKPALDDLFDSFVELLPSPEELARILREDVIPAIERFAAFVVDVVVPALTLFFDWVGDVLDSLGGFEGIMKKVDVFIANFQVAMTLATIATKPFRDALQFILTTLGLISKNSLKVGVPVVADRFAAGGILTQPTYISPTAIAGEAGREAIVPLDRPLNQIDPSVRALAAFAQGYPFAGGRGGTTMEAGAIQVITPAADPVIVASQVFDRFAEDLP
jgi:hypothetical protein